MSDPKTTGPNVQVVWLLENGHLKAAAEAWAAMDSIPLPSASMLCLAWLDARAQETRMPARQVTRPRRAAQ